VIKVALFIDNVDQLSPTYQAQIFLLAQQVTRRIGCITLIALREESYYMAQALFLSRPYMNLKTYLEYKKRGVDTLKAHEKEISKLAEDEAGTPEEENQ